MLRPTKTKRKEQRDEMSLVDFTILYYIGIELHELLFKIWLVI